MLDWMLDVIAEIAVRIIGVERCGAAASKIVNGNGWRVIVLRVGDDEDSSSDETEHLDGSIWDESLGMFIPVDDDETTA